MAYKMRVVGWNVQPVVMADDGKNLVPVQVGGQMIPAADWTAFKTGGDDLALAPLRDQIASGSFLKGAPSPRRVPNKTQLKTAL